MALNFGLMNPDLPEQIAGSFQQGYQGAQDRANVLEQREQQRQIADIQLKNALAAQQDVQARRAAFGAADPAEIANRLRSSGLGEQAFEFKSTLAKQQAERQKLKLDQAKNTIDLFKRTATVIQANPSQYESAIRQFGNLTGTDITNDLDQFHQVYKTEGPEGIQKRAASFALDADKLLPHIKNIDLGGVSRQLMIDPVTGKQISATDIPMQPLPANIVAQKAQIAAAGKPVTNINVSTEKKYGEAFAGKMADTDIAKMDVAEKAPQLAESANRIISIVKQGDVFTGPAANVKLNIARALNVAGANNQEKIANTESLIQATGQNTLNAIKTSGLGTGQGFTDKDLEFLRNIAGGTITLTPQTLTNLATLQHRVATRAAESWNKRVKQIPSSAIEGTGLSMEPIEVPPLASGKSSTPVTSGTIVVTPDGQSHSFPTSAAAAQFKKAVGL